MVTVTFFDSSSKEVLRTYKMDPAEVPVLGDFVFIAGAWGTVVRREHVFPEDLEASWRINVILSTLSDPVQQFGLAMGQALAEQEDVAIMGEVGA